VINMAAKAVKRAIIYLRVSTKQQALRDGNPEGYSLPTQRRLCHELAKLKGAVVVAEYIDTDTGRSTEARPGLRDMLKRVTKERDVDMVIIFKLDRWARNLKESLVNDALLEDAGCELVSYSEPMLDRSNAGRMMHAVLGGNNEYLSRNNGDEIRRKNLIKIQEGGTHGCARLGYLNVGEGSKRWVEPDSEAFDLLKWCFHAYATGEWSVEALTTEATERGLLTKGGPNTPRRPLSVAAMHRILTSPYYKGIVVYNGVEYEGKHQPLVDAETWERVQEVLSSKRQGLKQRQHHHYLKGTIWCGHCGERLVVNYSKSKTGTYYPYYYCVGRQHRRTTCMLKARPIALVEEEIIDHYRQVQLSAGGIDVTARAIVDELAGQRASAERKRKTQEKKLKLLEGQRLKLMQAHYAGAVPLDLLKNEQERLGSEIASLEKSLEGSIATTTQIQGTVESAVDWLSKCHQAYEAMSESERRLMNQAFFKRIWVTEDGVVGWEYNEPFASLMRKHQAVEPIFTAQPVKKASETTSEPRRTRYERRSPAQAVRVFFRQGLKQFNLAEGVGFEPTVP
jgi:site-specific DNA recombinase